MINIGIVTPYRIANYGTKLQAYALETYLNTNDIVHAEIIKYQPNVDKRLYTLVWRAFSFKRNKKRIEKYINKRKIKKELNDNSYAIRDKSINKFNEKLTFSVPINSYADLINEQNKYDCIICGSDQIWIPDNLRDGYYTLDFVKKQKYKGSYAASLGVGELNKKQKENYKKFLGKLDFVSLREDDGRDIVKNIVPNKQVEWVCDPTFLLSKDSWRKLENKPKVIDVLNEDYIFCYFIGTNKKHREAVYEYAQKYKLKVLTIANFRGYCKEDTELTDVQLYDLSVNEFLYLIDNAKLVCTDSMHATIFSIIFETDFWTFERFQRGDKNSRNSRIYSLLNVNGLEDRLLCEGDIPSQKIDFVEIREKKDSYIESSKNFIYHSVIEPLKIRMKR